MEQRNKEPKLNNGPQHCQGLGPGELGKMIVCTVEEGGGGGRQVHGRKGVLCSNSPAVFSSIYLQGKKMKKKKKKRRKQVSSTCGRPHAKTSFRHTVPFISVFSPCLTLESQWWGLYLPVSPGPCVLSWLSRKAGHRVISSMKKVIDKL